MGAFVIDRVDVDRSWSIMGSLRVDRTANELNDLMRTDSTDKSGSADFSNITGRIGATWALSRDLTLYGAWGQGFVPPSTQELGTNPNGYGGFNAGLTSATSNSYEAGIRGTLIRGLDVEATGFSLTTRNDFERYRMPGRGNGKEGTFYKNVGATKRLGLELFARYQPVPSLSISVAYTFSHFQYDISAPIRILMDDSTVVKQIEQGNWLPNIPRHRLAACIAWDIVPACAVALTTESMTKTSIDGANIASEAASGYTLIGAQLAYHWSAGGLSGTASLNVRNLGDIRYVAFTEPDPGGNAYQPGSGREFFAGIAVQR
jgi:iron complex outermembrane receptor protein